jgi:excisionase family DNA binding protein
MVNRTENEPEAVTVTVERAARMLGISRASAYEACRTGQLPSIRIGRRLVIPRVALQRMLDSVAA